MKTRESGMPAEEMWQSFFDAKLILTRLELTADCGCVVDFGCGYGTFSVPAAQISRGTVYAIDIDPEMVAVTGRKANELSLRNLKAIKRDFVADGCGLPDGSADYAMLFNILHAAEAEWLLAEAKRVLRSAGRLGVIHWNFDVRTPRGPSMEMRLKPQQCVELVKNAGFAVGDLIDLPPFHYGFVGKR